MSGSLRLSILIEAIDRASQPLAALQARLGGIAAGMLAVGQAAQRLSNVSGASLLAGALGNVAGRARDAAGAVAGLSAKLAVGAGAAGFAFNRMFIQGAAESENFRTRFNVLMGSVDAGGQRFNELSTIAERLRFPTSQVMEAGLSLQALGVRGAAADRTLNAAADASIAFSMSMNRVVNALASATRGEMDPIEAFGIRSKTEGNRIIMQWEEQGRQMRATVDKNNPAKIAAVVTRAWEGRARGAAEAASDNWDVMLRQIGSTWDRFKLAVMNAGPFEFLKQQLRDILAWIEQVKEDGRLDQWAQQIGAAITNAFQAIRQFVVGTEETPGALARIEAMFQRVSAVLSPVIERFGGLETLLVAMGVLLGGPLIAALVSLTGAMTTLGVVLALTPAGWFAMAAAGMAALGIAIYSNWDGIVALFGRLGDAWRGFMNSEQMQEAGRIFGVFADYLAERFNALAEVFTAVGGVLQAVLSRVLGYFQPVINAAAWVMDRVPGFGGGSSTPAAPSPRDAGRGNGLRRQSIYGDNALPDGAGGGVLPPANDVRLQAGLDVQIRAPEGFGVSVTQRGADDGMALNVRRGMLATP
ncbi:MAG: hypothetical protein INF88_13870 [Roseomonas sp.]|nr:hypothetical protein [Roseomonas sp.]